MDFRKLKAGTAFSEIVKSNQTAKKSSIRPSSEKILQKNALMDHGPSRIKLLDSAPAPWHSAPPRAVAPPTPRVASPPAVVPGRLGAKLTGVFGRTDLWKMRPKGKSISGGFQKFPKIGLILDRLTQLFLAPLGPSNQLPRSDPALPRSPISPPAPERPKEESTSTVSFCSQRTAPTDSSTSTSITFSKASTTAGDGHQACPTFKL